MKVPCNECGVEIEIASTTNFATCASCGAKLAVRRTGTSTFTERVAPPTDITTTPGLVGAVPLPEASTPRLSELERQSELNRLENELNRLDLEWDREKESYMIMGRYGHRYLPTRGTSLFGGVFITIFGTFWTIFACGITTGFTFRLDGERFGPPPIVSLIFPAFGVLFVIFGIVTSVNAYRKAEQYEHAHQSYLARRRRLLDEIRDVRNERLP